MCEFSKSVYDFGHTRVIEPRRIDYGRRTLVRTYLVRSPAAKTASVIPRSRNESRKLLMMRPRNNDKNRGVGFHAGGVAALRSFICPRMSVQVGDPACTTSPSLHPLQTAAGKALVRVARVDGVQSRRDLGLRIAWAKVVIRGERAITTRVSGQTTTYLC